MSMIFIRGLKFIINQISELNAKAEIWILKDSIYKSRVRKYVDLTDIKIETKNTPIKKLQTWLALCTN